jgi:hypothetical protein
MKRLAMMACLLSGLAAPPAWAQQAQVRLSAGSEPPLWAGQQVTINLELMTTGQRFADTVFNLPEVEGAFLLKTDSTTVKLSERIDGLDWQVLRYPLALFAQREGNVTIPPIAVRFSAVAGFGEQPKAFDLSTDELELTIDWPPGAPPASLVVSTPSLKLSHAWSASRDLLQPGDAINLAVSREAQDISGMLLPPLPVYQTDGLAAYPQSPEINDQSNRGDLRGVREDRITWIVEQPGAYTIPAVRFEWWDPSREQLSEQTVPGRSFSVAAGATSSAASTPVHLRKAALMLGTIAVGTLGLWWLAGRLRQRKMLRQAHFARSEAGLFTKVADAAGKHDARGSYTAITAWLPHVPGKPCSLSALALSTGSEALLREAQALQQAIIEGNPAWQGEHLLAALNEVREQQAHHIKSRHRALPSQLNPGTPA